MDKNDSNDLRSINKELLKYKKSKVLTEEYIKKTKGNSHIQYKSLFEDDVSKLEFKKFLLGGNNEIKQR